jgi:hypothetical protein
MPFFFLHGDVSFLFIFTMKNKAYLEQEPEFVEYNDEILEHVTAGNDYGQIHGENSWSELNLFHEFDEGMITSSISC